MKRDGAGTRGAHARAAFTLIELVLVMVMIAAMLGIGLGLFARLDLGDRIATAEVANVVRSAHNWAVARQAPARVVVDVKGGRLRAEGVQTIGTWHFESEPIQGAFELDGASIGGQIVEGGFQGQCLSFAGQPRRSRVEIPVHRDTAYDLRRGFQVRCAVRTTGPGGGALIDLGGAMGIEIADGGAVKAWFATEVVDEHGEARRGPVVALTTDFGAISPERWSTIEATYDCRVLRVLADGAPLAEVAETAPVTKIEKPLVISPGDTAFPGAIDNLVIAAVAAADEIALPKGIAFAPSTPAVIAFAPGGALDRERHREPLRVVLLFDGGREEKVEISLYGTVE